jgi:hypothetical protein
MEEFKKAVKVELDATKWALDRFNEDLVSGISPDPDVTMGKITFEWSEKKNIEEAVEV